MRIETLNFNNLMDAFSCVRRIPVWMDMSGEVEQSVDWLQHAMQHEYRGKIAFENNKSVGHVFYVPLSIAPIPLASDHNLIYVRCLYVDPLYRGRGIGRSILAVMKSDSGNYDGALLSASKSDTDMNYFHFEKIGFKAIGEENGLIHMFLPIRKQAIELRIVSKKFKPYRNKVQITLFYDDFCPMRNQLVSTVRKAAGKFGDSVELREIDLTPETAKLYGTSASFMIDGERSFAVVANMDEIVGRIESALERKGLQ
jgi:GNAT superfamily N-acetyltransferase